MTIEAFIAAQLPERQQLLSSLHNIIIQNDDSIKAEVEPMMGKKMIVYKSAGIFKYGLSSMKNYLSLHVMPIYGSPQLYAKYKELLSNANFQKGCINFKSAEEMPSHIVAELIRDCSAINLLKIKEDYISSKKKSTK